MYLRRLSLTNFRCYRRLELDLPEGRIVVAGRNAQGKTSLLEAVYVLATTRAPYAVPDRRLVSWDAEDEVMPYSRVKGEVQRAAGEDTIEIVTLREEGDRGEARWTKRARVNGAPKRGMDVLGHLNVVLFTPRDTEVVSGPPAERRRYLDILLCQIDRAYCAALSRYNRLLSQRNHLLKRLRDRGGDRAELGIWDERLAEDGGLVLLRRAAAVRWLDERAAAVHERLAPGGGRLRIAHRAALDAETPAEEPAAAAAQLAASLLAHRDEEIARGATRSGPHRDDLSFLLDGIDLRDFGSRGQQRTATLALKLAEAALMREHTGESPVLLLDDVLSELDPERRRDLLTEVAEGGQSLVSTTEMAVLPASFLDGAHLLQVSGGRVREGAAREDGPRGAGHDESPPRDTIAP